MTIARERGNNRGLRLLAAMLAAGGLALAVALPALAGPSGDTKLKDPSVDPRAGTTATLITFGVTYRNPRGQGPDYVRVVVGGTTYPMTASSSDWKGGVVFTVQTTVPAGTATVRFEAHDSEKFVEEADGGSITIDPGSDPSAHARADRCADTSADACADAAAHRRANACADAAAHRRANACADARTGSDPRTIGGPGNGGANSHGLRRVERHRWVDRDRRVRRR